MTTKISASNAHSLFTAASLADARPGFYGLITRLVGTTRGPKGAKVRYGDHLVHALFVGGIKYMKLVTDSLDLALATWVDSVTYDPTTGLVDTITFKRPAIDALVAEGRLGWNGRGKNAVEVPLTAADYEAAITELINSFIKTTRDENTSTNGHVFEPLKVLREDGTIESVRGSKVYKCVKADTTRECRCRMCGAERGEMDRRAPVDGQVNLIGIRVGQTIIEPAANGPVPASKSGGKTVAKKALRRLLPISRLVSYRLEQGGDWVLKAGGEAAAAAGTDGVTCDSDAIAAVEANLVA